MPKLPKLVDLGIEETSGVDHPAHMNEGWIVMKAQDKAAVTDVLDRIRAASTDTEEASMENLEDVLAATEDALTKAHARIAELEADFEEIEEDMDVEFDEMLKSVPAPVAKALTAARDEAVEALTKAAYFEDELRKEREVRADEVAIAKAAGWTSLALDANEFGPMLRRLAEIDGHLAKSVEEVLDAANASAESAGIFSEIGKSAFSGGDAYTEMSALAKAVVSEGRASTFEQAIASVAGDNPDLYARYLGEKA
jgi:hypothetical protein